MRPRFPCTTRSAPSAPPISTMQPESEQPSICRVFSMPSSARRRPASGPRSPPASAARPRARRRGAAPSPSGRPRAARARGGRSSSTSRSALPSRAHRRHARWSAPTAERGGTRARPPSGHDERLPEEVREGGLVLHGGEAARAHGGEFDPRRGDDAARERVIPPLARRARLGQDAPMLVTDGVATDEGGDGDGGHGETAEHGVPPPAPGRSALRRGGTSPRRTRPPRCAATRTRASPPRPPTGAGWRRCESGRRPRGRRRPDRPVRRPGSPTARSGWSASAVPTAVGQRRNGRRGNRRAPGRRGLSCAQTSSRGASLGGRGAPGEPDDPRWGGPLMPPRARAR